MSFDYEYHFRNVIPRVMEGRMANYIDLDFKRDQIEKVSGLVLFRIELSTGNLDDMLLFNASPIDENNAAQWTDLTSEYFSNTMDTHVMGFGNYSYIDVPDLKAQTLNAPLFIQNSRQLDELLELVQERQHQQVLENKGFTRPLVF